jgi:transketolase
LYAVLSKAGYFKKEFLCTLRTIDSMLQGHPNPKVPGVECVTGSLGQGLSIAKGIALADRIDSRTDCRTYVLLGDGELQEGQVYEARRNIAHNNMSNIIVILDQNGLQLDGKVEDISKLGNIRKGWEAAGWHVIGEEISWDERLCNIRTYGHDFNFLINSLNEARKSKEPTLIIASTIKGKGISKMENKYEWHGAKISKEIYIEAYKKFNDKLMELKWPAK